MVRYSELTIRNYRVIQAFGDAIVERLPDFLGERASVIGCAPCWDYEKNVGDYVSFSALHHLHVDSKLTRA